MRHFDSHSSMPFGKFKGTPAYLVDVDYLAWLLRNSNYCQPGHPRYWRDFKEVLEVIVWAQTGPSEPEGPDAVAVSRADLRKWYGDLARQFHPDMGGSTEAMAAINEAWASLQGLLSAPPAREIPRRIFRDPFRAGAA